MRIGQIAQERTGQEQQRAQHRPARLLGGDVEHHHEKTEEQQRRAQVLLVDQHGQAGQPHDDDRAEVTRTGQVDAEEPGTGQRQHVLLLHQVGRERDRQHDLGQLGGLEAGTAEP